MKRLPIVIAALALLAASCAQGDKAKPRIGLAMRSFDDPASAVIRGTIETAALDRAELAIIDGQNQQSAEDKQAEAIFERKLGSIAVNPVDETSLGPLIEKAKAQKVPIVFFGLEPPDASMRSWDKLFFVGTRREDARAAQGEMLASYWKANAAADRNKDGALQYVELKAEPDAQDPGALPDALARALSAAGIRADLLASDVSGGEIDGARLRMAALLAKYGDKIEAVACENDETALGAIEALKSAGYFKGKKRIPVVGAGELPGAVADALASGSLLGTAVTDTGGQAKAVFDLAYTLARGAAAWRSGLKITDAKYVWIPCRKVTKADPPAKKK
jgi:methyl-galactoside transport system substrate-binding protein